MFLALDGLPKDDKLCTAETTFNELLRKLDFNESDYISSLRVSLEKESLHTASAVRGKG